MEHNILQTALKDRDSFYQLEEQGASSDLSDQGKILYDEIRKYYEIDSNATHTDKEIIRDRLARKFPSEKHQLIFNTILDNQTDVSAPNVLHELRELRMQNIRDDIIAATNSGENNEKLLELFDKLKAVINQEENTSDIGPVVYNNMSIHEILDGASSKAKIKLSPSVLNEVTDGGVLLEHHLLMFARPDCGKTTLAIELTYGFLKQNLPVLYIGNEEPAKSILLRLMSRLLHRPIKDIEANPDAAERKAAHRNYNLFTMVQMFPGTCEELEAAVIKHQPKVLIIDQVRNIQHKNQNRVEQLEIVERFVRNLGKKYGMVTISFTQAGDSGDNKLILGMGDVDFSNTGMQAAADFMCGMGVNPDYERSGRRMLSFPKNKLSGDKQPRQVIFDPKLNRIY